MAELTVLDEKLGEVLGLAQAAQQAAKKVATLARKEKAQDLVELMGEMGQDAQTVEQHCQQVADRREGAKSAINKEAREPRPSLWSS